MFGVRCSRSIATSASLKNLHAHVHQGWYNSPCFFSRFAGNVEVTQHVLFVKTTRPLACCAEQLRMMKW